MKKEIWTYLETDGRGELLPTSIELVVRAKVIAAAAEQAEEEKYTICALLAGADHDALQNAAEKALGAGAKGDKRQLTAQVDGKAVTVDAVLCEDNYFINADGIAKLLGLSAAQQNWYLQLTADGAAKVNLAH